MMEIQIDPHTIKRAAERGATEVEIREVLTNGFEIEAKSNRLGKAMIFPFKANRSGKYYEEKRIEVFYIIENKVIITITVYVFYGTWRNEHADTL